MKRWACLKITCWTDLCLVGWLVSWGVPFPKLIFFPPSLMVRSIIGCVLNWTLSHCPGPVSFFGRTPLFLIEVGFREKKFLMQLIGFIGFLLAIGFGIRVLGFTFGLCFISHAVLF